MSNRKRDVCVVDGCFCLQRNRGHKVWGTYCDKHHKARPLKEIEAIKMTRKHKAARRFRIKLAARNLARRAKMKIYWSLPRTCEHCGRIKPASSYTAQGKTCNPCRKVLKISRERNTMLLRNYGISLQDYNAMSLAQNGVCSICGDTSKELSLDVDHCHTTGNVRGLLCQRCNMALGMFNDDLDLLASASSYLINSRLKIVS